MNTETVSRSIGRTHILDTHNIALCSRDEYEATLSREQLAAKTEVREAHAAAFGPSTDDAWYVIGGHSGSRYVEFYDNPADALRQYANICEDIAEQFEDDGPDYAWTQAYREAAAVARLDAEASRER